MASDTILYRYKGKVEQRDPVKTNDADGNEVIVEVYQPEVPHLAGVPARDLTEADVDALPAWLQQSVAASPLYAATTEGKKRENARKAAPAAVENVPPVSDAQTKEG